MINTFHFGGLQQVEKDGKKVLRPLPPHVILQNGGPIIPVIITHPKSVADQLIIDGKPVPAIQVRALIDTGAFGCVITPDIAQQLNLVQTGFQKVTSVNNEESQPAYFARLQFNWGKGKDVQVVCCPLKGPFDVLIGRDILIHWNFIYNGKDGFIIICD
ncbi:MAG: retropepsin-like aspartic protease [Bacteroidetes bacterium]|nr:retropepsin-like aspartic protease [Bacteroidota bacterium]